MTTQTKEAIQKLTVAVLSFGIEALILKWIWNSIGPAQGLAEITWISAMGWIIIGKTVLGTGAIKSAITGANRKKS